MNRFQVLSSHFLRLSSSFLYILLIQFLLSACCANLNSTANLCTNNTELPVTNFTFECLPLEVEKLENVTGAQQQYKLLVSGNVVKLSSVFGNDSEFVSPEKWPWPCRENNLEEIELLASESVIFDTDVKADRFRKLSILAPNWVLRDNVTISLDGADGMSANATVATPKNETFGMNGANGTKGGDGEAGGNFVGMFSKLWCAEEYVLTVTARGGRGGDGGNGENGTGGAPGRSAEFSRFHSAYTPSERMGDDILLRELSPDKQYSGQVINVAGEQLLTRNFVLTIVYNHFYDTMIGHWGKPGGVGGNGGDSGRGGGAGAIEIFNLGESEDGILEIAEEGPNGVPGEPGKGGQTGSHGSHLTCRSHYYLVVAHYGSCERTENTAPRPFARDGNGGQVPEERSAVITAPTIWRTVNRHKRIFTSPEKSLTTFVTKINSEVELTPFWSVLGFAEELLEMERKETVFNYVDLEYYEDFHERLQRYLKTKLEVTDQEKLVMSHIFASVLSKLGGALATEERVVNTEEYFGVLVTHLEALKMKEKAAIVEEQKIKFQKAIQGKIEELKKVVVETVKPSILELEEVLRKKSETLLAEIDEALATQEGTLREAKLAKVRFDKVITWKYFLSAVKLVATLVSLLGPVGKAVGGTIGALAMVAESLSFKVEPVQPRGVVRVEEIWALEGRRELESKVEMVLEQVGRAKGLVLENPGVLRSLGDELNLEKFAYSFSTAEITPILRLKQEQTVDQLIDDLKSVLESNEMEIETRLKNGSQLEANDNNRIDSNIFKALQQIRASLTFADSIQGFGNATKNFRLVSAILGAETEVSETKKRRKNVFNTIFPLVDKMSDYFKDDMGDAVQRRRRSTGDLLVKKWKVKGTLRKMFVELVKVTGDLGFSEEIKSCLDKLEKVIVLQTDLYEHIEKYEEQKQLGDYLANINSPEVVNLQVEDEVEREVVRKLGYISRLNLFLRDFNLGMTTFKRWVFPYADKYLKEDRSLEDLSQLLNMTQTRSGILGMIQEKVGRLHRQLRKYKATITSHDSTLLVSRFVSGRVSTQPFFVWRNSEWSHSIEELLSGNKVELKADLDNSVTAMGMSAVKFRSIQLVVKATNGSLQRELDGILDHFHVVLEHSGWSHYKMGNRTYVMFDKVLPIRYSFERVANSSITSNLANHKGSLGDFLLSPYTFWSFQLIDVTSRRNVTEELSRFVGKVDLHLEGEGVYLDEKRTDREELRRLNLDAYYQHYVADR